MSTHRSHRAPSRRKALIIRLSLAGIAVAGIGAAATTAAWTSGVTFSGSAQAATVGLQAKLDGTTAWTPATKNGVTVTIPSTAFQNMIPGKSYTVTVDLQNSGNVPLDVEAGTVATTGDLFSTVTSAADAGDYDQNGPAKAALTGFAGGVLQAGANETATLQVTTPAVWSQQHEGQTGSVAVTFTSSTDLPAGN